MKTTTIQISHSTGMELDVNVADNGYGSLCIRHKDKTETEVIQLHKNERIELREALRHLEPLPKTRSDTIGAAVACIICIAGCLLIGGVVGNLIEMQSRYVPTCTQPPPSGSAPAFWPTASAPPYSVNRSIWLRVDEVTPPGACCGPYKKLYSASCGKVQHMDTSPGSALSVVEYDRECIPGDWDSRAK